MGQITNRTTACRRRRTLGARRPPGRLRFLRRQGGDAAVGVDRDPELVEEVPTEETVQGSCSISCAMTRSLLTFAPPTSRESSTADCTFAVPVAPRIWPACPCVSDTPAATSARGLITVLSAPVSSISFTEVPPLIVAFTTIACPFTNLISVEPAPLAGAPAPAGALGDGGAFLSPRGTAVAR